MNDQSFDHWHAEGMEALCRLKDTIKDIHSEMRESLSFRDQCAIAAMQSLATTTYDRQDLSVYDVAGEAFDYADAMEAERQKRNNSK